MPAGAIAAAAISAASGVATSGINAYSVGKTNKKSRQFAKDMYNQQRADALSDWNMQNEYNSPEQQMRRYKEAGLNPNLIYGQQSEGPTVRSTPMDQPRLQAPQIETGSIGNAVNQYFDVQRAEADLKLKAAQLKNIEADTVNKLDTSNSGLTWNKSQNIVEDTRLKSYNASMQSNQIAQFNATYDDVLKLRHQMVLNAQADQGVKLSQTELNIENALKARLQRTDLMPEEKKKIQASIIAIRNAASEKREEAGVDVLGLRIGGYNKSKGIDDIMMDIDPDWNKRSKAEKTRIYKNLNNH